MDFRELTYITAVAEERSVTEAAKRLYISQPSLSYIISKVEQDLGVRLFDRKTNPLSLTYAGEIYVEHAREILRIRDNMRRELTDIGHGKKGRINIGIPNERAGYMLSRVMPLFRQQYPNMEIRLQESRSSEIIRNLLIDKIGFAVLPGDKSDLPPGLKVERIYRENLYVVAGDGVVREEDLVQEETGEGRKPLKAMSAAGIPMPVVRLQNLKDRPFIIVKEGTFIRRRMEDIFREAGFFPKEIMERDHGGGQLYFGSSAGQGRPGLYHYSRKSHHCPGRVRQFQLLPLRRQPGLLGRQRRLQRGCLPGPGGEGPDRDYEAGLWKRINKRAEKGKGLPQSIHCGGPL